MAWSITVAGCSRVTDWAEVTRDWTRGSMIIPRVWPSKVGAVAGTTAAWVALTGAGLSVKD